MNNVAPRWKHRPVGSNWGDFGPDDQKGRMNLLTPERRLAGLREAKEGFAFTLSLPLDYPGWRSPALDRRPPRLFATQTADGDGYNCTLHSLIPGTCGATCDDGVVLYTQYSTQWDSLAHWGRTFDADGDGVAELVYYNGFRAGEHIISPSTEGGPYARRLGIENLAQACPQGRGVLVNLHDIYGDQHVPVGYDGLMAAIESQHVEVRPGDFLLLYTGFDMLLLDLKKTADAGLVQRASCGLDGHDQKLLQWIDDSGLVAICSDNVAVELVAPRIGPDDETGLPLHELCLFKLGIHLGELWYLKELADWLKTHRRTAFLLTAPPLRLPGSVGSPANAIATV
jgi:kynurenine formamidase